MGRDNRSRVESLVGAANARWEAKRFRKIAVELHDPVIEQALMERAVELETLAVALEAQARTVIGR